MIPTDNPTYYLKDFYNSLLTGFSSKEDFLSKYYRALLIDSNVRHLKRYYQSKNYVKLSEKMEDILSSVASKTKEQVDTDFNITLYNMIKYHLDEFVGKENTDQTLETIRKELNKLINLVFLNSPPFTLHVEDTTSSIDESKTKGSKFSVRIVPKDLLF